MALGNGGVIGLGDGPFLAAGLTEGQKAVIRSARQQAEKVQDEPQRAAILLRAFDQVEKSLTPEQQRRMRANRPRVEPGSVIGLAVSSDLLVFHGLSAVVSFDMAL